MPYLDKTSGIDPKLVQKAYAKGQSIKKKTKSKPKGKVRGDKNISLCVMVKSKTI